MQNPQNIQDSKSKHNSSKDKQIQQSALLVDQGDVNERPKYMIEEERINEKKKSENEKPIEVYK